MIFCLLIAALLPQGETPGPEESARVEYVLVEVIARDRRNRLVTDLTLDDFVLRENGRKIPLESLDILDLREGIAVASEPPAASRLAPDVPRIRKIQAILAVDFEFTGYGEAMETFRELERYLEETGEHADLEYLIYSLEGGSLQADFSTDPDVALEALREYKGTYRERSHNSPPPTGDLSDLERRLGDCHTANREFVPIWNCVQGELAGFLETQYVRTMTVIGELRALALAFPDPESLKWIFFISPGFSANPGTAAMQLAQQYLPRGSEPGKTFDLSGGRTPATRLLPPPMLESFEEEFLEAIAASAESRVMFHTFDIYHFGMETERRMAGATETMMAIYRSYRTELDQGMRDLAQQTGGTFHGGPSLKHMRPVLEGDRFLYVLGYRSPPGKEGRFRKIRVKCSRPGVRLRHRSGYFG